MNESSPQDLYFVQEVFEEALTYPTGEVRDRFLQDVRLRSPEIASEVERLLWHYAAIEPSLGVSLPRFGPYQAVRIIGRGGMGVVYEAHRADGEFERRVAVKAIAAGFITKLLHEELRRERQILARLDHSSIARLFDGGVDETGTPYQVMELVDGRHLDCYCEQEGLSAAGRLRLFHRVLDAVEYAHSLQIVHLDLKPSNILVEATGQPKLLDFGAARLIRSGDPTLTARYFTPDYASPELMRGEPVDRRADIYSLGVLYSKLLGSSARPSIVRRATAQDPDRRYATVDEFRRGLNRRRWPTYVAAAVILLVVAWLAAIHGVKTSPPGPNQKAKELYELAQYHWGRRTPASLDKAIATLKKAVQADSNYADAYGLLAYCYAKLPEYHSAFDPAFGRQGRQAAKRALALDPKSAIAHTALGIISLYYDWSWREAEPEFKAGVALAPDLALPHAGYGMGLISQARFSEAETELRRAAQLEPESLIAKINLAELWFYAHRFDLEEKQLREILELDPNYVLAYVLLSNEQSLAGNDQEAIKMSKKLLSLPEGWNWCFHLAEAYARAGRKEEARRQIRDCAQNSPGEADLHAGLYANLGDYDHALKILETLYAQHDPHAVYYKWNPEYDALHDQPRFQRLVKNF